MAPKRNLKRTISNTAEIHPFLVMLKDQVTELAEEHQRGRTALLKECFAFQQHRQGLAGKDILMQESIAVLHKALGVSEDVAANKLKTMLKPWDDEMISGVHVGHHPLIFSYADVSMWRGTPPNPLVAKFARSMITTGYRGNSVIESRTLNRLADPEMPDLVSFKLLFGDGSARGAAACLAWILLCKNLESMPSGIWPIAEVVESLCNITVNYELHGDGGDVAFKTAQAARQNQHAMQLPVSTMQWITIVKEHGAFRLGEGASSTSQLKKTMESLVSSYNSHPDVAAYEEVTVQSKKRRRRSAGKPPVDHDDGEDSGLRIGWRRLKAMSNVLSGASEDSFESMSVHLTVVGDYKLSAFSDLLFVQPWMWIGSMLPRNMLPTSEEITTREAVSDSLIKIIPTSASRAEYIINPPFSKEQHDLTVSKVVKVYEDSIAGMPLDERVHKHKPAEEQWLHARLVIQDWLLTIKEVARKDLPESDFQTLESLVLETSQLDKDLVAVHNRWTKWFHMGLLPQLVSDDTPDVDVQAAKRNKAQIEAETSMFDLFELELAEDHEILKKALIGKEALRNLQTWRQNAHRRAQASIGHALVDHWASSRFPLVEILDWKSLSSQVSLAMQALKEVGNQKTIILVDFNCPGARDKLKMSQMVEAISDTCKTNGPDDTIVFAMMPQSSKEDAETTAWEDEVQIMQAFGKTRLSFQVPVRMLLDNTGPEACMLKNLPWFVDARLIAMKTESSDNFWLQGSELPRTGCVFERPVMKEASELLTVSSLDADEDLNLSERYHDVEGKIAQRGRQVAKSLIEALLTPSKRQQTSFLTKNMTVAIVDVHPHVGDRALAVYDLMQGDKAEAHKLVYLMVAYGKQRQLKFAKYAQQRVKNHAADEWLGHRLKLFRSVNLPTGAVSEEEVKATKDAAEPTEDELKEVPGALLAYQGIDKMASQLKVCYLHGGKIKIREDKVNIFATASAATVARVSKLQMTHAEKYENAFRTMANTPGENNSSERKNTETQPLVDGRQDVGKASASAVDLVEFESETALKGSCNIGDECKAGIKGLKLYKDERRKSVYAMATTADMTLEAGTVIGAVGGGTLLDCDENVSDAMPFTFHDEDKTLVQILKTKTKSADGEEEDADKGKTLQGTLYSTLRELESQSTKPITMTSFGKIIPVTDAGLQKYTFASPYGAENHRKIDFVLSPPKPGAKANYQNLFGSLLHRTRLLGQGPLKPIWRMTYDTVLQLLKPQKPIVVVSEKINLTKGKPVKLLWPSESNVAA